VDSLFSLLFRWHSSVHQCTIDRCTGGIISACSMWWKSQPVDGAEQT